MHVQPQLLVIRAKPRVRNVRRPFRPSQDAGPYKLPHDVRDRLTAALAPYRNRDSAFALAAFLGRFWSMPSRIVEGFCIDRRALTNHQDLGLTERQVRSAIATLEQIAFLDRTLASRSKYKATEHGLRRRPIRFVFGHDYFHAFDAANKRAAAARERRSGSSRPRVPNNVRQTSVVNSEAFPPKCPESHSVVVPSVYLGQQAKEEETSGIPAKTFEPNPRLESALARLEEAFRRGRGG